MTKPRLFWRTLTLYCHYIEQKDLVFPMAEMMSLGGVALFTEYSSTKEYINEVNGCPVAYRLIRTKKTIVFIAQAPYE